MRKNKLVSIMAVMLIMGIFMVIFGELLGERTPKKSSTEVEIETEEEIPQQTVGDENAYSYSDIQKYIAYLADTDEKKTELNRLVDPLNASKKVEVSYIKDVVSVLGADTDVYTGVLRGRSDGDIVSKDEFEKIYDFIIDTDVVSGITHEDIFVFGWASSEDSEDGHVDKIFDGRKYYSFDIDISSDYNDKIIDAYIKDGVIFKLNGYSENQIVLKNAWMIGIKDGKGSFLYGGVTKEYSAVSTASETDSEELEEGFVADIIIDNMGIRDYIAKTDVEKVKVNDIADGCIVKKNGEKIKLAESCVIYNAYAKPYCEDSFGILKGYKNVEILTENDEVCAIVVRRKLISDKIRVLLSNDDYSSYDMNTVTVTSDADFKVKYADGTVEENSAGATITIDHKSYTEGEKIIFTPTGSEGKLQILSINRNYGNPVYRGKIEVMVMEDSLRIINELPLEEYLYSVLSSEMNTNSPMEALRAMAICARGYAYSRILDESYARYDAHIDDSNLCQMYNSNMETKETIYAVKETYGIVPTYDGRIITPLYFSTSAGVTCTNSDIWGGNDYEYLKANVEDMNKSTIDLSEEADFIAFMDNSKGYDTIEKDMPFYRWQIAFTYDEISEAIKSTLEERYRMSPENISFVYDEDEEEDYNYDEDEEDGIKDIGKIKSIKVAKRSGSGVVMELLIEGDNATISVTGQTNIRNLITPVNVTIDKQDGSANTGWTSLPSPFYYVKENSDGFIIIGGGFGHGAGMSQNGARLLAEAGYDYEYILKHYYTDIELDTTANIMDIKE